MKDSEVNVYINPTINIKDQVIECENQTIQTSSVARTWIGNPTGRYCLEEWFPAVVLLLCSAAVFSTELIPGLLAGTCCLMSAAYLVWLVRGRRRRAKWTGLNVELSSGTRYYFVSGNTELLNQTYQVLNHMFTSKYGKTDLTVDLGEKGQLLDHTEKSDGENEQVSAAASFTRDSELTVQLKALLMDCEQNETDNENKLALVNQALQYAQNSDMSGLRELLGGFVEQGLIVNCNRLGLNLLIDMIKASIF